MSGSTLILAVITPQHVILANCGDSRALILGEKGTVLLETKDHKPESKDEKYRIEH